MKRILILLMSLIAQMSYAQTLSEEQIREAQGVANEFCILFKRYVNGERNLQNQIFELCSSPEISAYDEIGRKKVVHLRNYMMSIMRDYRTGLKANISYPILTGAYKTRTPFRENLLDKEHENNEDAEYLTIVFKVEIEYPTIDKSLTKVLIYSLNSKKITAFIEKL